MGQSILNRMKKHDTKPNYLFMKKDSSFGSFFSRADYNLTACGKTNNKQSDLFRSQITFCPNKHNILGVGSCLMDQNLRCVRLMFSVYTIVLLSR